LLTGAAGGVTAQGDIKNEKPGGFASYGEIKSDKSGIFARCWQGYCRVCTDGRNISQRRFLGFPSKVQKQKPKQVDSKKANHAILAS
jgi:hypothetical protein